MAKDAGPRLGRGLAALLGEAASVPREAGGGVREIGVELLEPGPFQPRGPIDSAGLEELAGSIRAQGVLQPLLARPHPSAEGRYQLVAGERRWRAAQLAGLHEVPVLVRSLRDEDAMAAALVENLQRQDLNAMEEAEGYQRLLDEYGLTQEKLAVAVSKSRSHVANATRLLGLPAAVQTRVRQGALTAGHARALLAHPDPAQAAETVIARQLSVRQTEALVQRQKDRLEKDRLEQDEAAPAPNLDAIRLEKDLSEALGLEVEIEHRRRSGVLHIRYQTLDQLDGLVRLLSASR